METNTFDSVDVLGLIFFFFFLHLPRIHIFYQIFKLHTY